MYLLEWLNRKRGTWTEEEKRMGSVRSNSSASVDGAGADRGAREQGAREVRDLLLNAFLNMSLTEMYEDRIVGTITMTLKLKRMNERRTVLNVLRDICVLKRLNVEDKK